jgi:K+-dependent Na+/Ca+ exchanger-like protein
VDILIAVILLFVSFYLLAVLTENFFVPAIDMMANRLRLSNEASGATLLAMGSSAPEFFTALIAVLGLAGDNSDIGPGAIVGSAIFNVLVIIGAAAMFKTVALQWKPVIRDQIFYIITIILLLLAFWDGKIILYEAVSFVLFYLVYVFLVVNWKKWLNYQEQDIEETKDSANNKRIHIMTRSLLGIFVPCPNKRPKLYVLTFILSILGIAALSWLLVDQISVIANALNINSIFLALTVLAAGTSVPDLIGSTVVAKQGRGDMAVSNAIGSNIFDILFGLGLSWMIVLIIKPGDIQVGTENLFSSIFLLFSTVVATLLLLLFYKWRIGKKAGFSLIALYIIYCSYIAYTVIS